MTCRTVTSIVKCFLCKIIYVISQRQGPFSKFNKTHAIFPLVILMVNMLSRVLNLKDLTCFCA